MTYRAEFEDEEIEVFDADNNDEAVKMAHEYEREHGIVFNIVLLDESYDEIETIW